MFYPAAGMNPAMAASMEAARLQHYMQMQQNAMLSSAFHPAGMSKTFHGMNKSTSNDGNHHDSSSQKDNHKREVNGMEVVSSSVTELRRKDRVKKEPRLSMADEDEDDEGECSPEINNRRREE